MPSAGDGRLTIANNSQQREDVFLQTLTGQPGTHPAFKENPHGGRRQPQMSLDNLTGTVFSEEIWFSCLPKHVLFGDGMDGAEGIACQGRCLAEVAPSVSQPVLPPGHSFPGMRSRSSLHVKPPDPKNVSPKSFGYLNWSSFLL